MTVIEQADALMYECFSHRFEALGRAATEEREACARLHDSIHARGEKPVGLRETGGTSA